MPQTLEQPLMNAPTPARVAWTREDCARFVEQGHLTPGRYELIEGDILRKMGQKPPHSIAVVQLLAWCITVFGQEFIRTQSPIDVAPDDNPTSEPEPDVFVLGRPNGALLDALPGPSDLTLVAEVSDTTLAFDLSTKAALYARAGIAEYWVLDVTGRSVTVHHDPQGGRYQSVVRYAADETVAPASRPDAQVVVSRLLPPPPQA